MVGVSRECRQTLQCLATLWVRESEHSRPLVRSGKRLLEGECRQMGQFDDPAPARGGKGGAAGLHSPTPPPRLPMREHRERDPERRRGESVSVHDRRFFAPGAGPGAKEGRRVRSWGA